jgi:hypothetical protein
MPSTSWSVIELISSTTGLPEEDDLVVVAIDSTVVIGVVGLGRELNPLNNPDMLESVDRLILLVKLLGVLSTWGETLTILVPVVVTGSKFCEAVRPIALGVLKPVMVDVVLGGL